MEVMLVLPHLLAVLSWGSHFTLLKTFLKGRQNTWWALKGFVIELELLGISL